MFLPFTKIRKAVVFILLPIFLLLIGVRLYLPLGLLNYLNGVIEELPGYTGNIQDIDVNLWRGAYKVQGLKLEKIDLEGHKPFLEIENLDVSIYWKGLLRGYVEGEVVLQEPVFTFYSGKSGEQPENEGAWMESLEALFPITINQMQINKGVINVMGNDQESTGTGSPVLQLSKVTAVVTNLSNVRKKKAELPSHLSGEALLGKDAWLKTDADFDLLRINELWDISVSCEQLHLPSLNKVARRYANLDFESGILDIYGEIALADKRIEGYFKFLVEDLKLFELDEEDRNILGFLWEAISGMLVQVFENQPRDQFATRVPFEGTLDNPDGDFLSAIASILKNAIVKAMDPGIENTISPNDPASSEG